MLSRRGLEWSTRLAGVLGLMAVISFSQGCAQQGYSVIASTATVIGVEVSQNPATQTPQAKLGYNRGEFAFVPTNRHAGEAAGNSGRGAGDTADVIMELRYGGIFDLGPSSGIYQRLAVGETAVRQDGAALLFSKNATGQIDPAAASALEAVKRIPVVQPPVEIAKSAITKKFLDLQGTNNVVELQKFHDAAVALGLGYKSYSDFAKDPKVTMEMVNRMRDELIKRGITF
jgi:hypothetical protein